MLAVESCTAQDLSFVSPGPLRKSTIVEKAYNGSPKDQYNLATYFLEGTHGFRKNHERGAYWSTQAVIGGETVALNQLGMCYLDGIGVMKDENLAFQFLKLGAEKGDVAAMVNTALLSINGNGTPVNYPLAAELLAQATERDYATAAYHLGKLYLEGKGVARDPNAAFKYLAQAADAGVVQAHTAIAQCYADGTGTAVNAQLAKKHWMSASLGGDVVAHRLIGEKYLTGAEGFAVDPEKGRRYLLRAALLGDAESQYKISQCYDRGVGGPVSIHERDTWFARALAQGHPPALAEQKHKDQAKLETEFNDALQLVMENTIERKVSFDGLEEGDPNDAIELFDATTVRAKRRSRVLSVLKRKSPSFGSIIGAGSR